MSAAMSAGPCRTLCCRPDATQATRRPPPVSCSLRCSSRFLCGWSCLYCSRWERGRVWGVGENRFPHFWWCSELMFKTRLGTPAGEHRAGRGARAVPQWTQAAALHSGGGPVCVSAVCIVLVLVLENNGGNGASAHAKLEVKCARACVVEWIHSLILSLIWHLQQQCV